MNIKNKQTETDSNRLATKHKCLFVLTLAEVAQNK